MERFKSQKEPPKCILDAMDRILGDKKFDLALDAGCGSGRYIPFFKKRCKKIIPVDIDPKRGLPNVRKMSLTNLKFKNNKFDFVYNIDVIGHMEFKDWPKTVSEMLRVVKPGGFVLITFPNQKAFTRYLQGTANKFLDEDHKMEFNFLKALHFKRGLSEAPRVKSVKLRGYSSYGKTNMLRMFWNRIPHRLGILSYYLPPIARGFIWLLEIDNHTKPN